MLKESFVGLVRSRFSGRLARPVAQASPMDGGKVAFGAGGRWPAALQSGFLREHSANIPQVRVA